MPPKIIVHHLNNSKSQRVLWALEELGLDYEIVFYKRNPGFAPPEMKKVHFLGKAPIVEIDGKVMAESGAVLEYLVGRWGNGKLAPDPNSAEYGHYLEMMHYPEGSFSMPAVWPLFFGAFQVDNAGFAAYADQQIALQLDYVTHLLERTGWLVGADFTAADLQIAFILQTCRGLGRLEGRPKLQAYLAKLEARPAYKRAVERGGPFDLSFGRG